MATRFLSLNFGVPGDGGVNVFEFKTGETSDVMKSLLKKEDYDAAGILDRRFKLGPRQSPVFQSEDMEFIWADDFSVQRYVDIRLPHIMRAFKNDPELRADQIAHAKIDILASQRGISVDAMLLEAIEKLVFFDAHSAWSIRKTMSHSEFRSLHNCATNVVHSTVFSIFEELQRNAGTVFFLQEISFPVIEMLQTMIEGLFKISYNATGSTAIIYPIHFEDVHPILFPTEGNTYLHEEVCAISHDGFVYISVHCSAKTKEEATFAGKTVFKNMDDQLVLLNSFVTQMKEEGYTVIVGGDFNQRITPDKVGYKCLILPQTATSTTCKERGALQVQFKKINKRDSGSKDCICIFSDTPVADCRVRTLYKDGHSFCSYALKDESAKIDASLTYPHMLQCPDYAHHFPDHFVVEVVL